MQLNKNINQTVFHLYKKKITNEKSNNPFYIWTT